MKIAEGKWKQGVYNGRYYIADTCVGSVEAKLSGVGYRAYCRLPIQEDPGRYRYLPTKKEAEAWVEKAVVVWFAKMTVETS